MTEKNSTKASKRSPKTEVTEALMLITWTCGECGNVYAIDVDHCPNGVIDDLITRNLFDMSLARRLA